MSRSSPTTTRAVNEKRRPPLTTLATRLISTTRSWRSRPVADTDRSGAAMKSSSLEAQPALAGSLGERAHAPVVLVAAAVEHRGLEPGGLRPVGQQLARAARLVERLEPPQVGLGPADGGQRAAGVVVDELGEDPAVGAEHGDARPLGGAAHLGADAAAALEPAAGGGDDGH